MRGRGPPLKPVVSPHPVSLHPTRGDDVMTTSAAYLENEADLFDVIYPAVSTERRGMLARDFLISSDGGKRPVGRRE